MSIGSPEERLRAHGARTQKGPLPALVLIDPRRWTEPAPRRRWVVQDWIPHETVTALYGDGGIGKSLLAQQLLTSVAMDLPWCGMPVTPGRALGIFCEDPEAELQRRQEAINRPFGIEMSELSNLRLLSRLGENNAMVSYEGANRELTTFAAQVTEACEDFRPSLLVLDTAADLYPDNENDRSKVRWFIGSLARLAITHQCAIVLLAHPSQSGLATGQGTGGSTAWNNTVRSRLYLDLPDAEDPDARLLRRMKANYAARGGEVRLRWDAGALRAEGGHGNMPDETGSDGLSWDVIETLFRSIDAAWKEGRPLSTASQTKDDGRWFPLVAKERHKVPIKTARTLVAKWCATGWLTTETVDLKTKVKGLKVLHWLRPGAAPPPLPGEVSNDEGE